MKRKSVRKVLVNGTAYLFSVILLLSMIAAPVIASVSANSIGTYHIKDNSILNKDIRPNKISSSRIKNNTILNRDIHENVISSARIRDNTILNRDVKQNVISSSRIRNGTISNADISGSAAIADSKINYSTKTKHLSLPAAAFTPMSDTMNYANAGFILLPVSPSGSGGWVAPVSLPDGAKITKFRLDSLDASSGADINGILGRYNYPASAPTPMANVSSSGNSVSWQHPVDNTIAYPVIDNINNNYSVVVSMDTGNLLLGGVLITYEVTGP